MTEKPGLAITRFHRRRFPRIDICLPVEYSINHPTTPQLTKSGVIGGGGLMLYLPIPVAVGSLMELKLHLPGHLEIICSVRVVWTELLTGNERKDFKTGVEFKEIAEDGLQLLRRFIKEQQNPFEVSPSLIHDYLNPGPFK